MLDDGSFTYTHDAAGRLRTVTDWDGGVTVYTYTAAGRLSGMQLPNGVTTHYGYDAAGRLVQIEHRDAQGALLAQYAYTLDGVGNRVRVEETILQPDEEPHGPGDVTVTVRDTNGDPEAGLPVYGFDDATYTGYHGTTSVTGTVTLAQLPEGSYRFRVDKNGTHFWSGAANHCAVPGCTSTTVTTTIPLTVTV
ncbi:MAG: RHS repeat domain-containing protein, partial [Anaerolineae bacterium]